jgi:ABC-type enterochelin transport system ATPase subunit
VRVELHDINFSAVVADDQVVGVAEGSTRRGESGNQLLTSDAKGEAFDCDILIEEIRSIHSIQ